jgi:hypothetical protein
MGTESSGWIIALLAIGLVFWTYYVSKAHHDKKEANEAAFDEYEFQGNRYLSIEENSDLKRVEKLMEAVSEGKFALMTKEQTPTIAILPITEFLRIKTIENHLEDEALIALIVERLENQKGKALIHHDEFLESLYAHREDLRKAKAEEALSAKRD